jgi:hypothetical protein
MLNLIVLMACSGNKTDTGPVDTGPGVLSWQDLPGPCTPPETLPEDPLDAGPLWDGEDIQTMQLLVELVETEAHPELGMLYASGQSGLQSYTLDPATGGLTWLSMYPDNGHGRFERIELLADGHVALASRSVGLEIVDLSDPLYPQSVSVSRDTGVTGMHHLDGLLYAATQHGDLLTLELQLDNSTREIDRVGGLGSPWEMVRVGDRLYVADQTLGVVVFDISDSRQPMHVATVAAASGGLDLQTDDRFLYVAVGSAGVEIFDLADPDLPASVAVLDSGTPVVSVAIAGDHLWAVDHDGVQVASVADPTAPLWLGFERTELYALHVDADGDRAWVADWTNVPSYVVTPGVESPSARPSPGRVFLVRADEPATLTLRNDGPAPLTLSGGSIDDDRVQVQVSGTTAPPGGSILVTLVAGADGADLDATLCLATDDPESPVLEIEVGAGSFNTDERAGAGDLQVGDPAPDFALSDLDGQSWRLSEQLGHPVALLYFASW